MGIARGLVGRRVIQSEKETLKCVNDCLAFYLQKVRSLEAANQALKSKIWEHLEKKGLQVRNWRHYFKTIKNLRPHIFVSSVDNAHIVLKIGNACLAADDFRVCGGACHAPICGE